MINLKLNWLWIDVHKVPPPLDEMVLVAMCGNANSEGDWETYETAVLLGKFQLIGDIETEKEELCFKPENYPLFVPDDWDFFPLDKDFKTHLDIDECLFNVAESDFEQKWEYHDKYYAVVGWMPIPEIKMEGNE